MRRLAVVGAACFLLLAGCGGSGDASSSGSYLGVDATAVTFLRWTETDGQLTGTARFTVETDPATGTVKLSNYDLTGRRTGNRVTFTLEGLSGGPWEGRIHGSRIDLQIPQADGTIKPFTFKHASIPDYNRAVEQLRAKAERDAQSSS